MMCLAYIKNNGSPLYFGGEHGREGSVPYIQWTTDRTRAMPFKTALAAKECLEAMGVTEEIGVEKHEA